MAARICVIAAALVLAVTAGFAAPTFPPLTGRVVEDAHILSSSAVTELTGELKALEDKSSDQLVVFTTSSLGGYAIEDYGYQLGRAWGIGQKGLNNGVVLIVAPNEHKVRIEVGRGLEPQLTDALSELIIQNAILPAFRRGDFTKGITAGVHDISDVLLGDAEEVKQRAAAAAAKKRNPQGSELVKSLLFMALIVFFVFVFWRSQRQAAYGARSRAGPGAIPPIIFPGGWGGSGGWRGGGGGGSGDSGGGWSGGGGDFGGGGASGGW